MNINLEILDSSLRDGAQSEKISYSVQDKITICKLLYHFGITYIEAGAPFSNPKDVEFFSAAHEKKLKGLVAFARTRRIDETPETSPALQSVIDAATDTVCLFGKSSVRHVEHVLQVSKTDNLDMISSSVNYLKNHKKTVIFDAEHFFDGYRDDEEYALASLRAAENADVLCLCDTNGSNMPNDIYNITLRVVELFPDKKIGIHCHDDSGLAVAGTIMAVRAGAVHIQGTFIGTGERCGNANLSTIIPNLQLKCGFKIIPQSNMKKLTAVASEIAEISNIRLSQTLPYVGSSAFAHKAGMHADGVLKDSGSFEHISPEAVGNQRRLLLSEMSGRAIVYEKIKDYFPTIDRDGHDVMLVSEALKSQENCGYQYEGAEASFKLLVSRTLNSYVPTFELISYMCINEQPATSGASATATVKIKAFNKTSLQVAEGDGPVNALDKALRGCLTGFYSTVARITLADYKVRVLTPTDATAAKVRVLITSTDGNDSWTTVGVSSDIIEASWLALVDSFEYKILNLSKLK